MSRSKGQGHQGQKRHFSALSAACVRFVFGKTSLASTAQKHNCAINLHDAVTLGGAYTGGESFSSRSTGSSDLLLWAVGWQQQQRRRRLFALKAEVAAQCVQLASAGPVYLCVSTKNVAEERESTSARYLSAGSIIHLNGSNI